MYITAKEYVDYLIDNIMLLNQEHNTRVHEFEERFRILEAEVLSTAEAFEEYDPLLSSGLISTDILLEISEKFEKYKSEKIAKYNELQEEYDEYIQSYVDRISNEIVLTTMIIENHLEVEINGLEIMNKLLDLIK